MWRLTANPGARRSGRPAVDAAEPVSLERPQAHEGGSGGEKGDASLAGGSTKGEGTSLHAPPFVRRHGRDDAAVT